MPKVIPNRVTKNPTFLEGGILRNKSLRTSEVHVHYQ